MIRHNPFKGNRFLREVFLLGVRWYWRFPLSYRGVQDILLGGSWCLGRSPAGLGLRL